MKTMKVMIVAPHPDDAELSMGGTIIKMTQAGWDVVVVDLTDGEPTPFGSRQTRRKETQKASRILALKERICLDMPNRRLRATLKNRRKLAQMIRLCRPDLLFGPITPDYHPDHVEAAKLVTQARFEARLHKTHMQGRPHWSPQQLGYYSTHRHEYNRPSFVVDVTDCWDRKLDAIKAYQSQVKHQPPGTAGSLLETVDAVCRYFGCCIGARYGEPFHCCGPVAVRRVDFLADLAPRQNRCQKRTD